MGLVLFADELDAMFAPVARTSLQGQIEQGTRAAGRGMVSPQAGALEAAFNYLPRKIGEMFVNQEKALDSIRRVLTTQ